MAEVTERQGTIDQENRDFWDEACGTVLARELGVTDRDAESLRRYDDAYFAIYPYLLRHVALVDMRGKRVLEIGLGHGNLAQKIAAAGAAYSGLDIARGPVGMVRHRFAVAGLPGQVLQGSILQCPFDDGSFDHVVSIGVLHHTGNFGAALREVHRVLKPGGRATIMVYNAYSYRRWLRFTGPTLRHWLWNYFGLGDRPTAGVAERRAYDHDSLGGEPPATEFLSRRELRTLCRSFQSVRAALEQTGGRRMLGLHGRLILCATLGRLWGLDIYATLTK
jgi:SAM-dependent methyltransferase